MIAAGLLAPDRRWTISHAQTRLMGLPYWPISWGADRGFDLWGRVVRPGSPRHAGPLGLQPPPEKMVGVGLGGLTTF